MAKLNITQVRSRIGSTKLQKKNLDALGLTKINKTVQHDDSATILGMLEKVKHLVKIEVAEAAKAAKAPKAVKEEAPKEAKAPKAPKAETKEEAPKAEKPKKAPKAEKPVEEVKNEEPAPAE